MRVWLAGGRSFGMQVFDALSELPRVEVVAVTATDRDPLQECGCHVAEIDSQLVKAWSIDLIVSAQNYKWIPDDACEAATLGAIGYHPSLLPRHRGRSAVEWTVAMEDPVAGGTVYKMDGGWDTGPIIRQDFCHVLPEWSASDLWRLELFPMGIRLLSQVVDDLTHSYGLITRAQDERFATYEPPWTGLEWTFQRASSA